METPIKSEHLFIFPFSWKEKSKWGEGIFRKQPRLQKKQFERLQNWKVHLSSIESDQDYNEYVYFYKPIRRALYTFKGEVDIVRNYNYEGITEESFLEVNTSDRCYHLQVEAIELKLYKTGIGLLSFKIVNRSYDQLEDIKAINRWSMCIYPPVLPISKAIEMGMPTSTKIQIDENRIFEEHFVRNYHQQQIEISPLVMQILGPAFGKDNFSIEPILGSQMFCCCTYYAPHLFEKIDSKPSCQELLDEVMMINKRHSLKEISSQERQEKTHYLMGKEHLYGISPYMLCCITRKEGHGKLYDQLVKLTLMQRATLLNLSSELAYICTLPKSELSSSIAGIYEIYIQFINELYFKEVTQDAEGSYIFEQLTKVFKIEEELEQLNFEVDEVHEYATLVEQSASNLKVQLLTIIGAALVIPSFVTGFFGMNIFQKEALHWWENGSVILWLNSYVVLPILAVVALCLWTKKRSTLMLLMKVILSILFLVSLSFTFKYGSGL